MHSFTSERKTAFDSFYQNDCNTFIGKSLVARWLRLINGLQTNVGVLLLVNTSSSFEIEQLVLAVTSQPFLGIVLRTVVHGCSSCCTVAANEL